MKRFFGKYKILLLSLLVLVALVGSTYAYLIASDNPVFNSFAFGKPESTIHEDVGGGGVKVVTIENTSTLSVYVRARVLVSGGEVGVPQGKIKFVASEDESTAADEIKVVWNSDKWQQQEDGWFYYKGILGPGATTENLITKVLPGSSVDTGFTFDVDVYQEAVTATSLDKDKVSDAIAAFN